MSDNDFPENGDEDLELLRQAALSSLLKKKTQTTSTKAVFYRPSTNSNLISIQPVVEFAVSKEIIEDNACSDGENEVVIAEGLSVSSSDCDEIIEEVVVSEEDDENNNNHEDETDGEDAVSVASKDSFDEILNSIEQEINGVKRKPSTGTNVKKRKESVSQPVKVNEKSTSSPESLRRRSRSPRYRSYGGRGDLRQRHEYDLPRKDRLFRDRSRSRSPRRRISRSRSRSRSRHSNSPYRGEFRRHRTPERRRERPRYRSNSRGRSPVSERPCGSRSRNHSILRSPNHSRHGKDVDSARKSSSPSLPHSRNKSGGKRSLSPTRSKGLSSRSSNNGKEERKKNDSEVRRNNIKRNTPSPDIDISHLTEKEREIFEKRKRKFQSTGISMSGKVVLKANAGGSNAKRFRGNDKISLTEVKELSKERLERKLKLSSRLGKKVNDDEAMEAEHNSEDISASGGEETNITFEVHQEQSPSPKHQIESSESDHSKSVDLDKEDLRTKLKNKRVGRLFTAALKDTFHGPDESGSSNEKSRRKLVQMNQ